MIIEEKPFVVIIKNVPLLFNDFVFKPKDKIVKFHFIKKKQMDSVLSISCESI